MRLPSSDELVNHLTLTHDADEAAGRQSKARLVESSSSTRRTNE